MNTTIKRLVSQLGLLPHPEGGFYKEELLAKWPENEPIISRLT
ncbi:MAG: hypothetical protein ACXIUD_01215 [Mongoliitalea sp.]